MVSRTKIPKKKFYVVMTDSALSGWGHAEGKTNKFVIGCDTWDRASELQRKAKQRSDMKYVNIRVTKPYYDKRRILVSYRDAEEISW